MPYLTYNIPSVGAPHSTEDPKTRAALGAIKDLFNGNLDDENLADGAVTSAKIADALAEALGINNGTVDGRGYHAVATAQSTSSTSATDLSTVGPTVTVDVPTNGFVYVYAEATLNPASSGGAAIVALYEATDVASVVAIMSNNTGSSATFATVPGSTAGVIKASAAGGFLQIPATAGTRTYKLQYARFGGSGNVTFSDRKLWVIAGGPMP